MQTHSSGDLAARLLVRLNNLLAELRELLAGELDSNPMQAGELARDGDPAAWSDVLATVTAGRELLAAELVADIAAAVAALVEPEAQAAVLAGPLVERWPWRRAVGADPHGPVAALYRLRRHAVQVAPGKLAGCDVDRWPDPNLTAEAVAEWARGPLNRLHPAKPAEPLPDLGYLGRTPAEFAAEFPGKLALGDRLVAEVAEHGRIRSVPAITRGDGVAFPMWPECLALLCLATRPDLADAAAWRAVRRLATDAPGDIHNDAARTALVEAQADPAALPLLARELWALCGGLVARVAPDATPPDAGKAAREASTGGMLAIEADLAAWLADTFDQGNLAALLTTAARERWTAYTGGELDALGLFALWADGGAELWAFVAGELWRERVAELWARTRTHRAAVVRAVAMDTLLPVMTRQAGLPGLDDGTVRDKLGRELGKIATVDVVTLDAVRRGLNVMGNVTGHRLVKFLVHTVHDQAEALHADPRAVELVGGWSALADALQYTTRDFDELRLLLQAGQHVEWTHKALQIGGLWTWSERRGGPGRPGYVRLIVGDALAPGLAGRMADGGGTSRLATMARRLVPELRHEPPVSAVRLPDQGKAWTLSRLVTVELVDRAEELHRDGAIDIGAARWRELATQAGLPLAELHRLRDSWQSGDDKAPALLVETGGRVTLAEPHAAERDFIADAGRRRSGGRTAGRIAAQRRADKGKT